MKVTVIGLGYVGLTVSACLSDLGHKIIGLDRDQDKIDRLNNGESIIKEEGIEAILSKNVLSKNIIGTVQYDYAINNSDLVFICVDTPIDSKGLLYMENIYNVSKNIAKMMLNREKYLTIVIRSTVLPGTNEKITEIINNSFKYDHSDNFNVVSNPEFLREGSAIKDFYHPPYTIIGTSSDKSFNIMKKLYSKIDGEIISTDPKTAESIKLINNSFHALKVSFANEIGRLCGAMKIDSHRLMELFVKDRKLNVSPYYFKPGFAYGGSCLSKDLKSLNTIISQYNISAPVLNNIENSNNIHIKHIASNILDKKKSNIGIYGLAFKSGTDDLRSSACIELTKILIREKVNLKIFDSYINKTKLLKIKDRRHISNKEIFNCLVPDLSEFLRDLEVLVLVNKDNNMNRVTELIDKSIIIIDYTNSEFFSDFKDYHSI